jgi:hypothetical protein
VILRYENFMKIVLCLPAFLTLMFHSYAPAEAASDSEISFSVPYICTTDSGDETRCLTNPYEPGLRVVLLGEDGTCSGITADQFRCSLGDDFESTRLAKTDECLLIKHTKRLTGDFRIAVVGVDPVTVNLVPFTNDNSPVAEDTELRARKIVPKITGSLAFSDLTEIPVILSDAKPKVFRTDNVTLLMFGIQIREDGTQHERGPMVALINGEVFPLTGDSIYDDPKVFSVNGKLHLTYSAAARGWEDPHPTFIVYDLSSGTPQKVHESCPF